MIKKANYQGPTMNLKSEVKFQVSLGVSTQPEEDHPTIKNNSTENQQYRRAMTARTLEGPPLQTSCEENPELKQNSKTREPSQSTQTSKTKRTLKLTSQRKATKIEDPPKTTKGPSTPTFSKR